MNPPIASESKAANSIAVPSSHIGATICMPTGNSVAVSPTGAMVAGRPDSVAEIVHQGVAR